MGSQAVSCKDYCDVLRLVRRRRCQFWCCRDERGCILDYSNELADHRDMLIRTSILISEIGRGPVPREAAWHTLFFGTASALIF